MPIYAWFITGQAETVGALVVIGVFVFVRHEANIRRLLAGNESRIGDKGDKTTTTSDDPGP